MTDALTGLADLHIHTTISDGVATPQATLDYLAKHSQLNVVAITDHDRLEGSLWAYSQRGRYPFDIVPGVEVSSADGHVLALWVTNPIPRGLSLEETTAAIHEQGGLAVLAHPFELFIAPHTFFRYLLRPNGLLKVGIDGVEIHNAGAFTPFGNFLARRVYGRGRLPVLGNSDSHIPTTIGSGITRFRGHTADHLRESLELGLTSAEGRRWGLTVYWKIYRTYRQLKQNDSLAASASSTRLTQP